MFDEKSRYARCTTYHVVDRRGRTVEVVDVPLAPAEEILGYHRRIQGQRLDHLAAHYLEDPAGFWRLAEANDAMTADALAESRELAIPVRGRR